MGGCLSLKLKACQVESKLVTSSFQTTKSSSFMLSAPPLLSRKEATSISLLVPSLKGKSEIIEYLCSLKLNMALESGESLSKLIFQLILKNGIEKETVCELAGLLFEKIHQEEHELKNYNKPKIMKKIFEEYYLRLFRQYATVIKGEVKTLFFLIDYNFSFEVLCETIEIYQILLSYKGVVNNRKRNKSSVEYWWLTDNEGTDDKEKTPSVIDTFVYLQQKFISLQRKITMHYTSILADYVESRSLQNAQEWLKFCLWIDICEI